MQEGPDLSIVIPVFNGACSLHELFDAICRQVAAMQLRSEVLFVDDGSSDDSWQVIMDLHASHGEVVRGFRLARNSGQQAATYCGILEAKGDWIVTMDDDLQTHPRELATLWERAQATDADVVYGVFPAPQQPLLRRLATRIFRKLLRRVAPQFPEGSSFRLIRSDVVHAIPRQVGPWVLVDPILGWYSSTITTVAVEQEPSRAEQSRYSTYALLTIAIRLLFTHSVIPLLLVTALGLLTSVISFGIGVYYLVQKITVGAQLGCSALIVSTTFFSGVILLNLGILGEYISRIHGMGSGEPAFAIRSRI